MNVVFANWSVSLSPMIASPNKNTSMNLVKWPESLVSNVSAFDFYRTPLTTSEEP